MSSWKVTTYTNTYSGVGNFNITRYDIRNAGYAYGRCQLTSGLSATSSGYNATIADRIALSARRRPSATAAASRSVVDWAGCSLGR